MQFGNPIIHQLIIYGATDNLPDIKIGPDPSIILYSGLDPIVTIGVNAVPEISTYPGIKVQLPASSTAVEIGVTQDGGSGVIQFVPLAQTSGYGRITLTQFFSSPNNQNRIGIEVTDQSGLNDTNFYIYGPGSSDVGGATINKTIIVEGEAWHDITLLASWTNSRTAQYRLLPDGTVLLRGLIRPGTTADGTIIATLPAGYRPSQAVIFICAIANALNTAHVEVQTDGDLAITRVTAGGDFLSLASIQFATTDLG